jgi:hypothetical protein
LRGTKSALFVTHKFQSLIQKRLRGVEVEVECQG